MGQFDYRRLHILLKREGVEMNWKKPYRLYKEERLMVCKRGDRKSALGNGIIVTRLSAPSETSFPGVMPSTTNDIAIAT